MLTSALTLALSLTLASVTSAADVCNGHAELCSKSYGGVTFLGTHNSAFVGDALADNQSNNVTVQLNDGIRTMSIQAHTEDNTIHLCHSSCLLEDAGPMADYLNQVSAWVAANPTEVITLVIVNSDNQPPSAYASLFESAGLASKAYTPASASLTITQWPTLGEMVDSGKTVVVFMDYNADFNSVPYIMDEFSSMWQDAFGVQTTEWGCAVNRSTGSPGSTLMLVNHFLDESYSFPGTDITVPNTNELNTTNSAASLTSHVNNCNSIYGRNPNHILLDYYNTNGNDPFNYVAQLNGVPSPTNTVATGEVETRPTGSAAAAASASGANVSGSGRAAQVSSSALGAASSRVELGFRTIALSLGAGAVGMLVGGSLLG